MLTQRRLKELFTYDPETGLFIRKVKTSNRTKVEDVAGSLHNSTGYIRIKVDGKLYQAHRLAFLYVNGKWPKDTIDHINVIKTDNSWCNLREATRSENLCNQKISKRNKSGYKGVVWNKKSEKWQADIRVNRKRIYLGVFDDILHASMTYDIASIIYHKEFSSVHLLNVIKVNPFLYIISSN